MNLRKSVACTVAALAFAGAAAGSAQAANDSTSKFGNRDQVLSCDVIEILDNSMLSAVDSNIDCSDNAEEKESRKTPLVDEEQAEAGAAAAPRGR